MSFSQLETIIRNKRSGWLDALRNQKAVYLITDTSNGKMFDEGKLTPEAIQAIMSEQKPNQRERIVLSGDKVRQYIPKNIPLNQTEDYVCKALEHYASYLRKRAERDAR